MKFKLFSEKLMGRTSIMMLLFIGIHPNWVISQELTLSIAATEFVFDDLPHESCHASTIAEINNGLACAWFGGKREGDKSVGIWFAKKSNGKWSSPRELATGEQKDGQRFPCWNPVLFKVPQGPLVLFYKVGPNPREWWGMQIQSTDQGKTWSLPKRLPDSILGPIKNKPVLLENGILLCGSSTEHNGWKVHTEWIRDLKRLDDEAAWGKSDDLENGVAKGAIQPTILVHAKDRFQMLCRNQSRDVILTSFSSDGKKWSPFEATDLPNPNSGIDAVTLRNGWHLVVYNHTRSGRSPINVAVSSDGRKWKSVLELEREPKMEFSYPAVIQTSDGKVHLTYTWKRNKIKHVLLDMKLK